MKKLIYLSVCFIGLYSCNGIDYKYKIQGYVKYKTKEGKDTIRPAIAWTDTIYGQNEDSIWYFNTNGSKLTLLSPYTIHKNK